MPGPAASPQIEFWFDFASTYSYLSVMRIEQAAAHHDVAISWKPVLLGPVFKALGWATSPFQQQPAKADYMWLDLARQCHKYGLPWTRPNVFPRRSLLALRLALLGAGQPWMAEYCRRVMQLNFAAGRDIDSIEAISELLTDLGLPAARLIEQAQGEANKQRLREQTDTAISRGLFGAPTFFVAGEMFWGDDRLDEALTHAAALRHR